jgi:phosphatidylglycerophosphate synthase
MSKLATQDTFLDLSDYGRQPATCLANLLKNTRMTPIHVTLLFGVSGIIAIYCILRGHYLWAGFFLILKSILDAADGELSRVKNTPSYTGRYLDSIFDIILNFSFLMAIYTVSDTPFLYVLLAFICIQMQGTLYNYYYVILRNSIFYLPFLLFCTAFLIEPFIFLIKRLVLPKRSLVGL